MRHQSIILGLALGATPGFIWLLVRAMGGMGVNQRIYLVDVVAGPILFAAIGGILGAMAAMLFAFIRTRRGQPISMSKSDASLAGLLAGIIPGLNGLIFASVFLQCGGDDSLSGNIVGCDNLRTVYVLSAASITMAGGLLGAMAGRFWAARRGR